MFDINFNGANSFSDFGLVIESRPIIPVPQKNVNQITVPGRNGSLTEDDGTYSDIEIPISFGLVDKNNIHESCRRIKRWLIGTIIDTKLILSDDTEHFYKVKYVKFDNIERLLVVLGRFTATFVCEPFTYSNNEELITLTSSTTIFNPGTVDSKPYIKIYGSGNIGLTINGVTVTLTGVDTYIEVDSDIEECYKDSVALNNKMSGEFPILKSGDNTISWSGSVTKIDLLGRWGWF